MTDGSSARVKKGILALSAPLMVSFMMRQAFILVDGLFAAQIGNRLGVGDSIVAAIGLTGPFDFLMIACWVGTSNGLTSRLAAAMGQREGARIEQLKRATLRIIFALFGIFLSLALLAFLFAEQIAPDVVVAREFRVYATVVLAGSAFTSFWAILPDSVVKAHHDTKSTMWAGILSNITNVVLMVIFCLGWGWGTFGIALSTVLGRLAGLAFAVRIANRHEKRRIATGQDTEPGTYERPVRAILSIAVPGSITFMLMSLEIFAINELLKRTEHPVSAVAAWSVFDRWLRMMAMPVIAMGVAMLPLAARSWGERDIPGIKKELRTTMVTTFVYVLFVVVPFAVFFGAGAASKMTSTEESRELAELGMRYLPLGVISMAPLFVVRSAFEGLQMPRPGLIVSLIRTLLLAVPFTWLGIQIAEHYELNVVGGAYAGFNLGVAIGSALLVFWLRRTLLDLGSSVQPVSVESGT